MTENALKAKSNGVHPPFGYYVDDTDHYQIDETTAPLVKEIYELFLDGKKPKEIISLLSERGIIHGKYPIGYNFLYRILTNRKYIGEYKFGDIVLPNAMPAIIDEETFDRVQKRIADNKKAPAMHRSEDDYLLTTRLFCGKCGAMMAGENGTSHTSRQYRYYRCSRSKKHLCDKKAVKKDWIKDLVIQEVISLISDDGVLDDLAERFYQMQSQESNATLATKGQLEKVQKKLDNLAQAIAQGIFSSTTKKLLDDLEEQKQKLEIELFEAETRHPILSKDQILHALCNYRKLDLNTKEGKQRLIDSFVNSIYLYDDHFIITFNYKRQSKTVTFEEVNSSPFTASGSPLREKEFAEASSFLSLG